ncbi:hypothetical protein BV20DRAFT_965953 [Pilatotrama ljubarskyi]|nr:hypothetical protein BV20DRAFT_965953 [Pilatotrama ljubarskyi]
MVNIVSSFRALIHRFLGRRMADQTTLRVLLHENGSRDPRYLDVEMFEDKLVDACRRDDRRDILSRCVISRVVLYKQEGMPEHEYIVADVVVPDSDGTPARPLGGLKAERTVATEDGGCTNHSKAVLSPASSSGVTIPALDRFFVWDPPTASMIPNDHQVAYAHDFPVSDRPSIALLIATASVLHEEAPNYFVRTHQCYWFAGVLFRMLVGEASQQLPLRPGVAISVADEPRTVNAGTFLDVFNIVTKEDIRQTVDAIKSNVLSKEARIQDRLRALRAEHEAEQQRARASREALEREAEAAKRTLEEERAEREAEQQRARATREALEGKAEVANREAEAAKRRAEAAEQALEDLRAQLAKVHHDDVPTSSAPLAG